MCQNQRKNVLSQGKSCRHLHLVANRTSFTRTKENATSINGVNISDLYGPSSTFLRNVICAPYLTSFFEKKSILIHKWHCSWINYLRTHSCRWRLRSLSVMRNTWCLVTVDSTEQSAWELMVAQLATEFPAFHYHVHNSPPLDPYPEPDTSIHILTPYFFKIHFNVILLSTP